MKTHTDEKEEQKHASIQRVDQEPGTGGTARFIDNRPKTVRQLKLIEAIKKGKPGNQPIVDNRPSTIYQRKLRETMDTVAASKALPVQRKANTTGLSDNLKTGVEIFPATAWTT